LLTNVGLSCGAPRTGLDEWASHSWKGRPIDHLLQSGFLPEQLQIRPAQKGHGEATRS
jgi:hypothetical protein